MTNNQIILNNKIRLNTKSGISDIYGVAAPHEIELHNTDFALILKCYISEPLSPSLKLKGGRILAY